MDIRYKEYLKSDHWKEMKVKYRNSTLPQFCCGCGSVDFQLHHKTYKNLYHENLVDFLPLCQKCHFRFHKYLKENKCSDLKHEEQMKRCFHGSMRTRIERAYTKNGVCEAALKWLGSLPPKTRKKKFVKKNKKNRESLFVFADSDNYEESLKQIIEGLQRFKFTEVDLFIKNKEVCQFIKKYLDYFCSQNWKGCIYPQLYIRIHGFLINKQRFVYDYDSQKFKDMVSLLRNLSEIKTNKNVFDNYPDIKVTKKYIEASYPYCDSRLTRAEQDKIRKEMVRKFGLLDI
jgi:hypothetical protein